jgi:hypothetical protein
MPPEENDRVERAKEHASTLEAEISRLKSDHGDVLGLRDSNYREFWAHAKQISELFKTLKPLLRDDRERLWASFSTVCEETKKAEAREREARGAESREKRGLVMSKIKDAYHQAKGAQSGTEFANADALLREALEWKKDGWDGFNTVTQLVSSALSRGRMTREDHEECWSAWKEAKELLRLRRDEFGAEQRARLDEHVERWRALIAKNEAVIENIQTQIDRCEEMERDARTEEHASRVRGWIEEKAQKISDIQKTNEELEAKIVSVESKRRR